MMRRNGRREKVARIIYETDLATTLPVWENISEESRNWFRRRAARVLAFLEEYELVDAD